MWRDHHLKQSSSQSECQHLQSIINDHELCLWSSSLTEKTSQNKNERNSKKLSRESKQSSCAFITTPPRVSKQNRIGLKIKPHHICGWSAAVPINLYLFLSNHASWLLFFSGGVTFSITLEEATKFQWSDRCPDRWILFFLSVPSHPTITSYTKSVIATCDDKLAVDIKRDRYIGDKSFHQLICC